MRVPRNNPPSMSKTFAIWSFWSRSDRQFLTSQSSSIGFGNTTGATLESATEKKMESWWRKRMCWYCTCSGNRRDQRGGTGFKTNVSSVRRLIKKRIYRHYGGM